MKIFEQQSKSDNEKRVEQLWDKVVEIKYKQELPPFAITGTGIDFLGNFDNFKTIFYSKKYTDSFFNYIEGVKEKYPKLNFGKLGTKEQFYFNHRLDPPKLKTDYAGDYQVTEPEDAEGKKFTIINQGNTLFFKRFKFSTYGKMKMEKVSEDEYKIGDTHRFVFIKENDIVTGGEFTITEDGIEETYTVVKTTSGREGDVVVDDDWKCINEYNNERGFVLLQRSADGTFKFQPIRDKVEGREIDLVFYKNGDLIARYREDSKPIPNMTGTWECGEDGKSYKLIWDSGKVVHKGTQSDSLDSDENKTEIENQGRVETKTESPFTKACGTNIKACPTKQEVLDNKKAYSLCMKCPEIKELQESPRFSTFYSIRLRTMNLPEKTDEYFGPAMELAVKDFQASNRLGQTGKVSKYTYERITMPYKPVVFDDKKKPVDIKKVETGDEWLRPNSKL